MKNKITDHLIVLFVALMIVIGIMLIQGEITDFYQANETYKENYTRVNDDYIRVQVERTIEMVGNHFDIQRSKQQKILDQYMAYLLRSDFDPVTSLDHVISPLLISVPKLDYFVHDGQVILKGTLEALEDYDATAYYVVVEGQIDDLTLVLCLTEESLIQTSKEKIIPMIRDIKLNDHGYLWVNEILNYEGGDDYAIRKVHPNLIDTEGTFLSTHTEDLKGGLPYLEELNSIKEDGEAFIEYYFKKKDTNIISKKRTYVKLYEPYNWVIATGYYLDDFEMIVEKERSERADRLIREVLVISGIVIALFIVLFLKIRASLVTIKVRIANETLTQKLADHASDLEDMNIALQNEVRAKEKIEQDIRAINEDLDLQVAERTIELERLNEVLKSAVVKSEESNAAKSVFLSVISHELRTPLNGINGFIQMLEMTELNEEQEEIVDMLKHSSKHLMGLTDDILDAENYASGQMLFDERTFNMKEMMMAELQGYRLIAENKGLVFDVDLDESDIEVRADDVKIMQLIANLVSNGIKFTKKGEVTVQALSEIKNHECHLDIIIKDTGIGMKDSIKPYIFEPFTQANIEISKEFGGTGLGLSICKEIARFYNGHITVESDIGIGTLFSVHLVLPLADQTGTPQDLKITGQQKVLVVDDHPVNQILMKKFLDGLDVSYDVASDGLQAIEYCKQNNYSMIFMDCQMPIMDGFEATEKIRALNIQCPIIAITAYSDSEIHQKCLNSGMDEVLTKPIDLDALSYRLGKIDAYRARESVTVEDRETESNHEVNRLMKKIGLDYESCNELVKTFVQQIDRDLLELDELVSIKDIDGIHKILHRLRGASQTIHISRFLSHIEQSEFWLTIEHMEEFNQEIQKIKDDPLLK